jgi:hypothetical protein
MLEDILGAIIGVILLIVGTFLLSAIFCALPAMLLWNWLMPTIFGLTKITFWQAFGLCFLASCIFGRPSSSKND